MVDGGGKINKKDYHLLSQLSANLTGCEKWSRADGRLGRL